MKRVLVVGGGSIGERHVRCFLRTGRAEVALCEISDEVRSRVAREYELAESFKQLDEAPLPDFDAAVICTPAHLHVPMAIQLAKSNLAVLIEKPLSTSLQGIDQLEQLVAGNGVPVSVAYVMRHHPALRAIKAALDAGRFGQPVEIVATSGQHFPFYRPAYRDTYYARHETGGGAIQDAITHTMNAAEWLVGPIERLVADAAHCVLEGVDVEDTVHLLTRHSELLGSFSLNQHQSVNESTMTVICERGSVRMEAHRQRWLSADQIDGDWQVEERFELQRDDLFVAQAEAFLDQLDGSAGPACSLADAKQTLRVNLAALHSVESGQWISI